MKTVKTELSVDVSYPQIEGDAVYMQAVITIMGAWILYHVSMKTYAPYDVHINESDHTLRLSNQIRDIIKKEARMYGRFFYETSQAAVEQSA